MTDIEFQSLIQLKKIFAKKDVILPFTGNCNTYDLTCHEQEIPHLYRWGDSA